MNILEIETLVELVAASDVRELVLRNQDRKLTIRKPPKQHLPATGPTKGQKSQSLVSTSAAGLRKVEEEQKYIQITSPMVGIFRHAEPPVGVGTRVEQGTVVGIIESMKLMNEVHSKDDGVITEILVEGGMPVEYGYPLFAMENP